MSHYDDDDVYGYSGKSGAILRRRRITKTRLLRKDTGIRLPTISTDSEEQTDGLTAKQSAQRRKARLQSTGHES